VDISVDYLRVALQQLQQRHPDLPMLGLGMDFSTAFALPGSVAHWLNAHDMAAAPRMVFYPGSSIGNFTPVQALALLQQVHGVCAEGGPGGGLLIGVDRIKSKRILEPAYDDALGVTAAFNRNLLLHVNRLLGADFAPGKWQHIGLFNETQSRIEMHLQTSAAQTVHWDGGAYVFSAGARLHTESSYKWEPAAFETLLRAAGFGVPQHWTDEQAWFSVFWAPVSR
jgi:dimethylhistidine N-methyltransferase